MPDNSFDIVSEVSMPEVLNSVQQALKEIHQRYDLKDSKSNIELNEKDNKLVLTSADEFKLNAVNEVLQGKLVKRKVPLKAFTYGKIETAAGSTVRQEITLQQGIPIEKSAYRAKTATRCRRSSPPCAATTSASTRNSPTTAVTDGPQQVTFPELPYPSLRLLWLRGYKTCTARNVGRKRESQTGSAASAARPRALSKQLSAVSSQPRRHPSAWFFRALGKKLGAYARGLPNTWDGMSPSSACCICAAWCIAAGWRCLPT